jgi:hypothetical protein
MPLLVKAEADMPRSVQLRFPRVFGSCAPGTGRRPEDGGGSGADLAHVVVVQVYLGVAPIARSDMAGRWS